MWWSKNKDRIKSSQEDGENAIRIAQVGFMDMLNMDRAAARIERGNKELQRENHFGDWLFGVGNE